MNDRSSLPQVMECWARFKLPGRISVSEAARILGFAEHDIPVLSSAGLLKPLGTPSQNSTKWFASIEILRLATDTQWLDRATKKIAQFWQQKRSSRKTPIRSTYRFRHHPSEPQQTILQGNAPKEIQKAD